MSLEDQLTSVLRDTYEIARDHNYTATYFLQMLEEHGGLETARRLLAKPEAQQGLFKLYELDLLDISMEAVILQERFRGLFTEDELQEAYRRLEALDYFKE